MFILQFEALTLNLGMSTCTTKQELHHRFTHGVAQFAFSLLLMLLTVGFSVKATDLGPGDIAFTSFNSDGNKRFSFVLLTDISDSTAIYFTDNGWNDTTDNWYNTSEGTMLWYYNGTLSCGTEITIDPNQDTTNLGVVSTPDAGFTISATGDAILAYQHTAVNSPTTFISAINQDAGEWDGVLSNTSDSHLPDELTDGVNAVAFTAHHDNWQYNCTTVSGVAEYLSEVIYTTANWTFTDAVEYSAPGCITGCGSIDQYPSRPGSGYALDFDGVNDFVNIGDVSDATDFTFELWFKPNAVANYQNIFHQRGWKQSLSKRRPS
jgi:hypothetical protein